MVVLMHQSPVIGALHHLERCKSCVTDYTITSNETTCTTASEDLTNQQQHRSITPSVGPITSSAARVTNTTLSVMVTSPAVDEEDIDTVIEEDEIMDEEYPFCRSNSTSVPLPTPPEVQRVLRQVESMSLADLIQNRRAVSPGLLDPPPTPVDLCTIEPSATAPPSMRTLPPYILRIRSETPPF